MSLKKYEAFVRTVELGSLTKAAEAMGSTQSRISHVLSTLEEEYGFVLLRRNRSGVRLTEAGADGAAQDAGDSPKGPGADGAGRRTSAAPTPELSGWGRLPAWPSTGCLG